MPHDHRPPSTPDTLWVYCLCAQWCGVCREYRATFDAVASQAAPHTHFRWVDVEDAADVVEPVDIDDFPTLLIGRGQTPLFFGPVMPRRDALVKLIDRLRAQLAGEARVRSPHDAELVALLTRLQHALS